MKRRSTLVILVTLGLVLVIGFVVIALDYRSRRAPIAEAIDRVTGLVDDARRDARQHVDVLENLATLADRTLGADRETVDHALRSRLNRIGESVGLEGLSVNTTRYVPRVSPARSAFASAAEREVRDEIDLVEVEGSVTGAGSLEQVLRLVHRVQREPWPKRIDQLRIDPKDNGARFDVSMRLTTLFLPQRRPPDGPLPPPATDDAGFERFVALAATNPFRLPPPPSPEVAAVEPTPPPPGPAAGFPYEQWSVTGVVEGPDGYEVWLLNRATGESRRVDAGGRFEDLELVSAADGEARFRCGDERILVRVGDPFPARSPSSP